MQKPVEPKKILCIHDLSGVGRCSLAVIRTKVLKPQSIDLTPQESEQLSKFVSDDTYVKQQKEDIEELVSMFKGMLKEEDVPGGGQACKRTAGYSFDGA